MTSGLTDDEIQSLFGDDEIHQLALIAELDNTPARRCRMCVLPARIVNGQPRNYCGGSQCTNNTRLCQFPPCGQPFTINTDGAGHKYCAEHQDRRPSTRTNRMHCAWCNRPAPITTRPGPYVHSVWPYICQPCTAPIRFVIDRLRRHHVTHQRARQLITNPGCEICGTDIIAKVSDPRPRHAGSTRNPAAQLVVDHDHDCCPPGRASCGKCIRGLICTLCNTALGFIRDDPSVARGLATYLERQAGQPTEN